MTTQTEPLDASVTLDEILHTVAQKRAPLAPELAGYLVLELAESVGVGVGAVDPHSVYVSEEGSVALVRGPGEATGDSDAALRAVLGKLLETAGAQTPALAAVVRRKPGADLGALIEELEAALIPVNRSAGKRAIARLARETKRVTQRVGRNAVPPLPKESILPPTKKAPSMPAIPTPDNLPTVGLSREDLDAAASKTKRDSVDSLLDAFEASGGLDDSKALSRDLKEMAGLDPTPPPPTRPAEDSDLEALLAATTAEDPSKPAAQSGREPPAARRNTPPPPESPVRPPSPSFANDRQLQTAPSRVRSAQVSLGDLKTGRAKSSGVGVVIIMVFVLGGFAVALWLLKPGFLTGRTPEKIAQERAAAEAESARIAAIKAQPTCHATLAVAGAPKDAEILVREGQAPVDVDHMPMGTRLEFIATAEGYAPKRGVLEPTSPWDTQNGKARVDLPIQLDKSRAKPGAVDPWPAAELDTAIDPAKDAKPGTVHVITSPKGAEVWLVAGLGPDPKQGGATDVLIEDVASCDQEVDVLVAGPGTFRKRVHVAAASFVTEAGGKAGLRVAHVVVQAGPMR